MRKVVVEGTATLADVKGYEVGGKTGTAQIVENGVYTKKKINTFASVFPMSDPKFVLIVLLEDTKLSKDGNSSLYLLTYLLIFSLTILVIIFK